MKLRLFVALLALVVAPVASWAAEEENPYKKVKVGDYATYKATLEILGMSLEGTITQTVSEKTDKVAKLKVVTDFAGMKQEQVQEIDLTKPYDPTKAGNLPAGSEVKTEKLKDGTEKLKAGGKEYDCKWETFKVKAKTAGMEIDSEMKTWTAKDFLMQIVKMEMTAEIAGNKMKMLMELKESGRKSD